MLSIQAKDRYRIGEEVDAQTRTSQLFVAVVSEGKQPAADGGTGQRAEAIRQTPPTRQYERASRVGSLSVFN